MNLFDSLCSYAFSHIRYEKDLCLDSIRGARDSVEKNDSLLSIEQNFYFVQLHIPLTLLAPLLQILLQAHAFLIDLLAYSLPT